MRYHVRFRQPLLGRGFGFLRRGTIEVGPDAVVLEGSRQWPLLNRLAVLAGIALPPAMLCDCYVGLLVGLVVVETLCASPGSLSLDRSTIRDVRRDRLLVRFRARDPQTGELNRVVARLDTKDDAVGLERELRAVEPATAVAG